MPNEQAPSPSERREGSECPRQIEPGMSRRAFMDGIKRKALYAVPIVTTLGAPRAFAAGSNPSAGPSGVVDATWSTPGSATRRPGVERRPDGRA